VEGIVYTDTVMSKEASLRVCFATSQSRGDQGTDFVDIGAFRQNVVDYDIKRVVTGSGPYTITVTGVSILQTVVFKKDNCSDVRAIPSSSQSAVVLRQGGTANTLVAVPPLVAGTYQLCRGVNYSNYEPLQGLELQVIPKPTFTPGSNVAGTETPVNFSGVMGSDWVVMQQNNCDSASAPAGASLEVNAEAGQASLVVQSEGLESSAELTVSAPKDNDATLTLQEGENKFEILNRGSERSLVVSNGMHSLLSISHGTGAMSLRGDVTIGGKRSTGAKALTVKSMDDAASFTLVAGGQLSEAQLAVSSVAGRDAYITLQEGTHPMQIRHRGSTNQLVVMDATSDLFTVERSTGDVFMRGDLTVGGLGTIGARAATVLSQTGDSTLLVEAGGTGVASVVVQAHHDSDSLLTLAAGQHSFHVLHDGSHNRLVVNDGANDLFSVHKGSGDTSMRGDLIVGGAASTGSKMVSVHSTNGSALLVVESGGSSNSSIAVRAPAGHTALLALEETGGRNFALKNNGAGNFIIEEDNTELLSVAAVSGAASVHGDFVVGGSALGPVKSTVQSTPGANWLPKTSLDASTSFATTHTLEGGLFHACFATMESGGDASSDFVRLPTSFRQFSSWFEGGATTQQYVSGSGPHGLLLQGGLQLGDAIFVQQGACNDNLSPGSLRSEDTVVTFLTNTSILVAPTLQNGSFGVCRRPLTASVAEPVDGLNLVVSSPPNFTPFGGQAGMVTVITLHGTAMPGDFIVLKQDNCDGAFNMTTTTGSLEKTQINTSRQLQTATEMAGDGTLKVCYATQSSHGDEDTDFISLGEFTQTTVQWSL